MNIYTDDTHEAKFLVIECANGGDAFEDRMIAGLEIPSLLKPVFFNEECERYDISGYQTLPEAMKNRCLSKDEIMEILLSTDIAIRYLEERMLGDSNILLDPMFIYTDGSAGSIFFPVTRSGSDLFPERMRKLSELLFIHADCDDADTLRFASGLMKICLSESFRMHDIMRFIEKMRKEKKHPELSVSKTFEAPVIPEAVPLFDDTERKELFEREIREKTEGKVSEDGKRIRIILLAGAFLVLALDIICMVLGNGKAAKMLPVLLIISAAAAVYNIYKMIVSRRSG